MATHTLFDILVCYTIIIAKKRSNIGSEEYGSICEPALSGGKLFVFEKDIPNDYKDLIMKLEII